jgi:hypothetical protein
MQYTEEFISKKTIEIQKTEKTYIVHHWIAGDFHQNQHHISPLQMNVSNAWHQLPDDDRVAETPLLQPVE